MGNARKSRLAEGPDADTLATDSAQTRLQRLFARHCSEAAGSLSLPEAVEAFLANPATADVALYAKARMLFHDVLNHPGSSQQAANALEALLVKVLSAGTSSRSLLFVCLRAQRLEDQGRLQQCEAWLRKLLDARAPGWWADPAAETMVPDSILPWEAVLGGTKAQRVQHKLDFLNRLWLRLRLPQALSEIQAQQAQDKEKAALVKAIQAGAAATSVRGSEGSASAAVVAGAAAAAPELAAAATAAAAMPGAGAGRALCQQEQRRAKVGVLPESEEDRGLRVFGNYQKVLDCMQRLLAHISYAEPGRRMEALQQLTEVTVEEAVQIIGRDPTLAATPEYLADVTATLRHLRATGTIALRNMRTPPVPPRFDAFSAALNHTLAKLEETPCPMVQIKELYARLHLDDGLSRPGPMPRQVFDGDLGPWLDDSPVANADGTVWDNGDICAPALSSVCVIGG